MKYTLVISAQNGDCSKNVERIIIYRTHKIYIPKVFDIINGPIIWPRMSYCNAYFMRMCLLIQAMDYKNL